MRYSLQSNLKASHLVLILTIESYNNVRVTDTNSYLYGNILLFTTRFTKIRDYLNKMTNMPITPIPTINHFIHSNQYLGNLDNYLDRITKVLSMLNYLALPITPVEKSIYDSLNNCIEYKIAEIQLDQIVLHCFVRNIHSFIMGE